MASGCAFRVEGLNGFQVIRVVRQEYVVGLQMPTGWSHLWP